MTNNRRVFKLKEINRPFRKYDVSDYQEIYVDGYTFPIKITSKELKNKGNRAPKPATLNEDMIERLEVAGVKFNCLERVEALDTLKTINYYRLSVFALYLRDDKSFTQLFNLYKFDRFLRESINRLIPPIEVAIKTSLAYYLSTEYEEIKKLLSLDSDNKFEALVYLDRGIYKKELVRNGKVDEMLSRFSEFIASKQEKDPSIKHHVEYYSGNIPIWVLVEHLTIGDIATFITYLDRKIRKGWVRSLLEDTNDRWIIEWVKTIQFLRNTSAHCSRFYGRKFNYNPTIHPKDLEKLPKLYHSTEGKEAQKNLDKLGHTFFGGLLIMKRFYLTLPDFEKEHWKVFLSKLNKRINSCSADLYRIGFPENWYELLCI